MGEYRSIGKTAQAGKAAKTLLAALLFFTVITVFFYLLIVGIKSDYSEDATLEEIAQADLRTTLVPLSPAICDWYPEKFYAPEDFARAEDTKELLTPDETGKKKAMYGTYRTKLHLPKGRTYGISGLTCSYAQKVYVNGELLSEVGKISDKPEGFVPKTDSYSIFFKPETDTTELVVQLAHWNNKNGYFNKVYLAEQELIVATNRGNFLASGLIVGTLFAFAVFFFGMFLFYTDKRHLLWFSMVCFCSGLYFYIFQNKDIMALIPNLPWAISHKAEYLSQLICYIMMLVYTVSLLKLKIGKWHRLIFFTIVGAVVLFYIVTPSTFYSYHKTVVMHTYASAIIVATVYVVYRAIKEKIFRYRENIIIILCLLIAIGVYAFDFITDRNYNVMPFGTMLIVFFSAVAITMQFSRTERELNLSILREREIGEHNEMLEHMDELKNDFLHNIAHEMKTPLTVMSGYAQLTDWQIKEGMTNEETIRNLKTISTEALRLSDMVTRLLALSFDKDSVKRGPVEVKAVLEDAAAVCRPVLQKNHNQLEIFADELPPIHANAESILQVLVNLTINAGKHTQNGNITYKAVADETKVVFTVTDTGSGIAPELVPHLFEKGVSGDEGNGLGLAISKDIISQNGGTIELKYTGEKGTRFDFTVPLWREKGEVTHE